MVLKLQVKGVVLVQRIPILSLKKQEKIPSLRMARIPLLMMMIPRTLSKKAIQQIHLMKMKVKYLLHVLNYSVEHPVDAHCLERDCRKFS